MDDAVTRAVKTALALVEKELATVDKDIDGFADPWPKREDYRGDQTLEYIRDRGEHIEAHLHGKYRAGEMQKLYDRKTKAEADRFELANSLQMRRR